MAKIDPKLYRPSFIKEVVIEQTNPRKCLKCPTILTAWLKYYCSYLCKEAAMHDGSYGKEEEND